MEKRELNLDAYPRREHFDYFRAMRNPYVGVTADVDVTALAGKIKKEGRPFFLTVLYCAARAANAVPELRRRIEGNGIVEYDRCPVSYTVGLPDGTYCYCQMEADGPYEGFLTAAAAAQEEAVSQSSIDDGSDPLPLLFISTVPWLHYSALLQPTPEPPDSNPRITWGRYEERDGRVLLPVTVLCNHALVDGAQIAAFYEKLDGEISALTRE